MLRTESEVRADFIYKGISIASWASEHGFDRNLVYQVIKGKRRALRGDSHAIAVLLRMKRGTVSRTKRRKAAST